MEKQDETCKRREKEGERSNKNAMVHEKWNMKVSMKEGVNGAMNLSRPLSFMDTFMFLVSYILSQHNDKR